MIQIKDADSMGELADAVIARIAPVIADHIKRNCISRSELPRLPEHYKRPFIVHHYAEWGDYCWQVTDQETQLFAECESEEDAERLRDILNAVYPEGQQ